MAIQQVLSVYLNLKGDGVANTFSFALQNLYQFANGIAVPFGGAGVVPTAVAANNPPVPVTSVTVDANGNITLTTTSSLPASVFTFQLDLTFNSGSSSSTSATQTTNVSLVGSSAVQLLDSGGTNKASISAAGAVKVDGSAATQPVSGTVTANIGTTNGLALDASVTGLQVAQGSTTSGQKGGLTLGAVTTGAPTYTTAQTSPLSLTTTGGLRVDGSAVTQPVSGTVAATQSGTWTVQPGNTANTTAWLVTGTGGTFPATQSTSPWVVAGAAASGATKSGNPVQIGGVFNTTQPTVTTGQAVEAQSTARGAQIVATGVDTFNVTVNAALPSGTNVIGHVITDSGSTTAVTGTVTVSGTVTSNIGTTGGITVAQGSTTSGQSGPLMQGAVTTSAPTYTTAQTSPLSLDTSGNLRVVGSFSAGALPDLVGTPGTLNALNATATINAFGYSSVGMFLAAGTLIGTIVAEASLDGGTTWVPTFFNDPATASGFASVVFTAANPATSLTIVGVAGASNYRVRVSNFTSGTATCTLRANEVIDQSDTQQPVAFNTTAAAWTSATAQNTALTIVNGTFAYDILLLTINQTTTLTAGAVTFEASNDGVTWFARTGLDVTTYGSDISTYPLQASTYKVLKFAISAFQFFRVRLSTAITGTATVTLGYALKAGGQAQIQVQELKDSGRTYVTLRASLLTGVTTEALATFTKNVNGTDTTGQTAYTITNGKTFRIQALSVQIADSTTVANNCIYNVRVAPAVSATSPIVMSCAASAPVAVATAKGFANLSVADGIDIAGNGSIQIGVSHLENVTTASISSFVLTGYEY